MFYFICSTFDYCYCISNLVFLLHCLSLAPNMGLLISPRYAVACLDISELFRKGQVTASNMEKCGNEDHSGHAQKSLQSKAVVWFIGP